LGCQKNLRSLEKPDISAPRKNFKVPLGKFFWQGLKLFECQISALAMLKIVIYFIPTNFPKSFLKYYTDDIHESFSNSFILTESRLLLKYIFNRNFV